uniref:USP domain-containing protein n=1 Tax=Meloidogyne floridensis TaxID=298350 RepID=A0A915PE15_9BILA
MSSTGVTALNEDVDMTTLSDIDKHPYKLSTPPKKSYENVSSSSSSFQSTYSNDFGSKHLSDIREKNDIITTCSYDQNISKINFDSNVRENQNQPLKHSYNNASTKLISNKQNISGENLDQSSYNNIRDNHQKTSFSYFKGQNSKGSSHLENHQETSKEDNENEYTIKTRSFQKQFFERTVVCKPIVPCLNGLKNHTNTCYFNALMQCLAGCEKFAKFLICNEFAKDNKVNF